MAKDEKKAPEPKLYNRLHDRKIEDILADFQKLYHPDSQEVFKKERGYVRRTMRQRIYMHLAQHGVDDKTKTLKQHGYSHLDPTTKRKWAEDFLHTLALDGISMHLGKDAANSHAQNLDELREYIERHMVTDELKNYDQIVEKIAESKNLVDDFDEDPELRGLLENYVMKINSSGRKERDYTMHLQRVDYAPQISKYMGKLAEKQGYAFEAHTPIGVYLQHLAASANPEFKPRKNKFLKELPKKK